MSMAVDPRTQFERDYDQYADAIFRFLYYRLQNRERALELTQEIFARLYQYLAGGKTIEHTKAFLYKSAKNAFINEIRSKKESLSLEDLMDSGFEIQYEAADAESLSMQREAVARVKELDEPYRSALVMRYVDDLPVREIAEILGERDNTVSVWIKRGLEKLRKTYG